MKQTVNMQKRIFMTYDNREQIHKETSSSVSGGTGVVPFSQLYFHLQKVGTLVLRNHPVSWRASGAAAGSAF